MKLTTTTQKMAQIRHLRMPDRRAMMAEGAKSALRRIKLRVAGALSS
jgi:hypothetical protein